MNNRNNRSMLRSQMHKGFGIVPLVLWGSVMLSHATLAQTVTSDGTTATTVTLTGSTLMITGGDIAGQNLFHSFTDFSPEALSTLFNISDSGIERVISRVTGSTLSNINGALSVMGGNRPDFFLLNPNGIVFGTNAVLNVPGSFLASTAESLQFADGREFGTTGTSLLSVTAPTGLGIGPNPGSITNLATFTLPGSPVLSGLLVGLGGTTESIGLVGGAVNLTGGGLTALGGRVEVGAVGPNQTVGLTSTTTGYELDYGNTNSFADITLSQGAIVNSSSTGSGPIQLRGDRIAITEDARVLAATLGATSGADLTITARQLELNNRGEILSTTSGTGSGANIILEIAESFKLIGPGYDVAIQGLLAFVALGVINLNSRGSSINTQTATSSGAAGNITIKTGTLNLQAGASINSLALGAGNTGNLQLQGSEHIIVDASLISTSTSATALGGGGGLSIQTPTLQVQNGGIVSTSTFGFGASGLLDIAATTIELVETRTALPDLGPFAFLGSGTVLTAITATNSATGASGGININTETLRIAGGATLETNSSGLISPDAAKGGPLTITARESVIVEGVLPDGNLRSEIDIATTSNSAAGDLTITTKNLILRDGGRLNASATSNGASGTITVNASGDVILRNQGVVTSSAVGSATGAGGDIAIAAGGSLQLLDNSQITATTSQGNGGNLNLSAGDILLLRRGSLISTTAGQAGGSGNGGNITIDAPVLAGYDNSDIVANAFAGNGGNISITTQGIFGLAFRDQLTPNNDITASSQFGVNGTITVNEFSLDPSSGLVKLVAALHNASEQIETTCAQASDSEFIVTGRGGIPPAPEAQSGGTTGPWQDMRDLTTFLGSTVPAPVATPAPLLWQEATGFQTQANGQIALVAESHHQFAPRSRATCAMAMHP